MSGPVASILLPEPMSDGIKYDIRSEIRHLASETEGDYFWIDGRPFAVGFGPDYEGELEDYANMGFGQMIGWLPRDVISFCAMCNDQVDHRSLARLCLHFCRKMHGLIEFQNVILPMKSDEVRQLYYDYCHLKVKDWATWEPYSMQTVKGLPGKLYRIPHTPEKGRLWVSHFCDTEFLEAWLHHPDFQM